MLLVIEADLEVEAVGDLDLLEVIVTDAEAELVLLAERDDEVEAVMLAVAD